MLRFRTNAYLEYGKNSPAGPTYLLVTPFKAFKDVPIEKYVTTSAMEVSKNNNGLICAIADSTDDVTVDYNIGYLLANFPKEEVTLFCYEQAQNLNNFFGFVRSEDNFCRYLKANVETYDFTILKRQSIRIGFLDNFKPKLDTENFTLSDWYLILNKILYNPDRIINIYKNTGNINVPISKNVIILQYPKDLSIYGNLNIIGTNKKFQVNNDLHIFLKSTAGLTQLEWRPLV